MASFDRVTNAYDAGRPTYPEPIFDAIEPLAGTVVLECGAGTGIASRALIRRGARVVAFDVASRMLARARSNTPDLCSVVADGARLPFRDACADLVCFAQSWHWVDEHRRCDEAARVLRPGGRWAAWWSHPRADGAAWFDGSWDLIEAACPGVDRSQRDTDWGADVAATEHFSSDTHVAVRWLREVSVETWLIDEQSKSYIAACPNGRELVAEIEALVRSDFPDGRMRVPYDTRLWIAQRLEPAEA